MRILLTLLLMFFNLLSNANEIEMADVMRSNGKIYVVVSVLLTILIGLIVYLISIDRKLTRLEKELKQK
ncbi:MAG: CcmD family protein [Verrucomicrobia bacterium]|nr:CcmD family protein [Verrucomicrobiota bacterium]|tara:strand:+ start:1278 stop:1484 length:207 start_codon:yes stop_codon:yes gene_type:complete